MNTARSPFADAEWKSTETEVADDDDAKKAPAKKSARGSKSITEVDPESTQTEVADDDDA